ncbi:unnamed protein product [Lathyrus sativus]|nr:unnamed protein product [Lathyrus sativus]
MYSSFAMIDRHNTRFSSMKRKRDYENCIVCFDGDNFLLCDRRGCPNPYHPSCVLKEALCQTEEKLNASTGEDIISTLPDSLIYHILSFLPTKDAAVTVVLSKRWRPLWLSQLILDFDCKQFSDCFAFCNFLYSVMIRRDSTLPIRSLHLKCFSYGSNINNFIYETVYDAVMRGVENLNLYARITLPSLILSIKTLSVLKLKGLTLKDVAYVHLPSLKVLHLNYVTFTHYDYILKLLSGCPILKELGTEELRVELPYSNIPVKSLSNLAIANISSDHIEFDWIQNVERLRATMLIKKLSYTLDRIATFHNLTHLELIVNPPHFQLKWKFECVIKLLEYCPKLKVLIMEEDTWLNKIYEEDWEEPQTIPKCILSHLTKCVLRNFKGINCEVHFAKYILQNSRALRFMTIQSSMDTDVRLMDTDVRLKILKELSLCSKNSAACKLLFI